MEIITAIRNIFYIYFGCIIIITEFIYVHFGTPINSEMVESSCLYSKFNSWYKRKRSYIWVLMVLNYDEFTGLMVDSSLHVSLDWIDRIDIDILAFMSTCTIFFIIMMSRSIYILFTKSTKYVPLVQLLIF